VRAATDNVLDLFAKIQPSKMIMKPKLHLLTHLPEDIRRFGPLVGEATETFECFNAIFRFCSVLSNHQAPSRDIAIQLADQEGFKQRVTGGWWPDNSGGWKRAGSGVRSSLEQHKTLKNNLGWADNTTTPPGLFSLILITYTSHPVHPGTVRLNPFKKSPAGTRLRPSCVWRFSRAAAAVNALDFCRDPGRIWFIGKEATARSSDRCFIGSWVFCSSPNTVRQIGIPESIQLTPCSFQQETLVGKIEELLAECDTNGLGIAVVNVFAVAATRHENFNAPYLIQRQPNPSFLIVQTKVLSPNITALPVDIHPIRPGH
jgi:hypothetical protein